MPERSFGRTVRYRRTKLGLSQAKLAELVGRSTATVRSWERDKTRPNDEKVLTTLAAILGIDERHLFEKADMTPPQPVEETRPTVEQVLATLSPPPPAEPLPFEAEDDTAEEPEPVSPLLPTKARDDLAAMEPEPAFVAPPEPFIATPPTPSLADLSYVEDEDQRTLYRVRNLATLVAVVGLFVAFIWALGEGIGALGDWWDSFVGQLRL